MFDAIERGEVGDSTPESFLGLGTPALPPLPMHGGDRNRTSPFAFTGNKFEFRALGSSMSLSLPNTVLNTIVAEAIDALSNELEEALHTATGLEAALRPILQRSYAANKRIVFGGDNYTAEWETEAARRGLLNLRTTPDALPYLVCDQTVALFSRYGVLSQRELEARHDVFAEQYVTKVHIEAATMASIARTMLLPATARHVTLLRDADLPEMATPIRAMLSELANAIDGLDAVIRADNGRGEDLPARAIYSRDQVISAMEAVRAWADRLEEVVADDLWPLPKYSEILFIC